MRPTRRVGLTLIELCLALTVAAVLAGLAAPAFRSARRMAAVRTAAYDLMGDVQQSRGSAILEGFPSVLCLSDAAGICRDSPAQGWQAYLDASPGPRMLAERVLPEGLVIHGSRSRLRFSPGALAADAATLTICDVRGIAPPRAIVVSRGGRPRFASPDHTACRA